MNVRFWSSINLNLQPLNSRGSNFTWNTANDLATERWPAFIVLCHYPSKVRACGAARLNATQWRHTRRTATHAANTHIRASLPRPKGSTAERSEVKGTRHKEPHTLLCNLASKQLIISHMAVCRPESKLRVFQRWSFIAQHGACN